MDMNMKQLNEALEHDIAQKASDAAQVAVHPGVAIDIADITAIELRHSYYSKAVSLSYVDAAHACVRLALAEVAPQVRLDGDMLEKDNPKIDHSRVYMLIDLGERAAKIAKDLDALGDRSLVRYEESK